MFIPDKTLRYSGLSLACVLPENIQMSNLLEKYSEGVVDEPGDPEDGYGSKMICFRNDKTGRCLTVYERHGRLRIGCNPKYLYEATELLEQLKQL
jgi:hypothetical protein